MLNLLNWGNTILASIGDHFAKWGFDLLNTLIDLTIGPLLWALCDIFFVVLNLFESIFRTIAGVGQVGSDEFSGDIVLYLIQSDIVKQVFMSIFILSLFLLIIFTIFAIVKNQYADKQEPVSKIINSSFKALLMYLLVPIATVVCLLVGNVVLQAVDGATKPSASMSASDMLFVTAGYNANKLRDSDLGIAQAQLQTLIQLKSIDKIKDEMASIGITDWHDAGSAERWQLDMIANWVDEGFVSDEGLSIAPNWLTGNKWNYNNVKVYYHTIQMSYITIWVGGAFLIWAIGKIAWGLVARMFKMTFYYAISPAVMATFPLDNGKALGSWRGEMVKQGTMAFVAVGVMNVLYTILPFVNGLAAIGTIVTNGIGGMIIKLFINIIAFSSAKDLIATISGWFGTGDALGEGAKAQSQYKAAKSKLTGVATKAVGVFGGIKGGVEAASKHDKNKFLGAVTGALSQTSIGKAAFGEEFQKQVKAGGEATKTAYTTHINGEKRKEKLAQWEGYDAVEAGNKQVQKQLDVAEKDKAEKLQEAGNKWVRGDITLAEFEAQRDEIIAEYEKATEKIKSTASYLDILFEDAQRKLDDQKKKNEKRQSNFASMDNLEKAYEEDTDLRKRVLASSGFDASSLAYKTLEAQWGDIKQGNLGVIRDDATRTKIQKTYEMFASDIASNEHDMKRAKQTMANLVNSGTEGLKYVQKVLGDQFERMFEGVRDAAGEIESYTLKDTRLSDSNISSKIQEEQRAINAALKKWEQDNKDMVVQRAAKFGTQLKEDLEKIGKGTDKK